MPHKKKNIPYKFHISESLLLCCCTSTASLVHLLLHDRHTLELILKLSLSIPRPPADAGLRDGMAWPKEMPDVPSAFRPTAFDGYRLAIPLPRSPVDRTGVPVPPFRLRRRY